MTQTSEQVIAILSSALGEGSAPVQLDTELRGLGIGSLNLMKIIVRLEGAFDVEFADEHLDFSCFERVRDLVSYIEQRSSAEARAGV